MKSKFNLFATITVIVVFFVLAGLVTWFGIKVNQVQSQAKKQKAIIEAERDRAKNAEAKAKEIADIALAQRLSTQAVLAVKNPSPTDGLIDFAALLAVQSTKIKDDFDSTSSMFRTLQNILYLSATLNGHGEGVCSVTFSLDGKKVVSGSWDKTIRLWDVETGQAIGEPWQGHNDSVLSLAFSSDGKKVVSGSWDYTVRLWDVKTGEAIGEALQGHSDHVSSVAFSPDGTQVISGSWDNTLRLWNAETGEAIGEPWQGYEGDVLSVAFSPDGKKVVPGGRYKSNVIRLWGVETGKPIGEPWQGHNDAVWSVAFSSDSTQVFSGSRDDPNDRWDHMILLWDVDEESWEKRLCRIAGRNFTQEEWQKYLGDRPYEKTFPQYPEG